jgi:hypothetical protein
MAEVSEAATAHRDLALGRRLAAQAALLLVAIDFADSGVKSTGLPVLPSMTPV